jgi:uncharacterized coiled-coil protein SlyX
VIRVDLDNGKYTVLIGEEVGEITTALRHGEPWRDILGDKLIFNLAYEVHEQQARIAELEQKVKDQQQCISYDNDCFGLLKQDYDKAQARIAELEAVVEKLPVEIRKRWSFNDSQQHTHTWHDREDFIAWIEAAQAGEGK